MYLPRESIGPLGSICFLGGGGGGVCGGRGDGGGGGASLPIFLKKHINYKPVIPSGSTHGETVCHTGLIT